MMQDTRTAEAIQRQGGIQSISRAAALLRALGPHGDGLGLAELARRVELPKSTVHRLVGALAEEGLLEAPPGGRVSLGPGLLRLAGGGEAGLAERLRPVIAGLSERLRETVDLAVLDGGEVRFIDQCAASRRLQTVSAPGSAFPLHCTANGKALLAAMERERALALLPARLERLTPATITSKRLLASELDRIGPAGQAFDREEHTAGISAVGAVVRDRAGVVAAISVPVPSARFAGRELRYAKALGGAVREAQELLGAGG